MKRGQGSTETLLILGAVLLLAAVVVLVASNMLSTPKAAGNVAKDKAMCMLNDANLSSDYTEPYDGTNNAPTAITWKTYQLNPSGTADQKAGTEACKLGSYSLYFDKDNKVYYLTKADNKYYKYGTGGGQGGGGTGTITVQLTGDGGSAIDSNCGESGKDGYARVYSNLQGTEYAKKITVNGVKNPTTVKLTFAFGNLNEGSLELRGNGNTADYADGIDLLAKGLIKKDTESQDITIGIKSGTKDKDNRICDSSSDNLPTLSVS
jgi:hypothetical protein